MRSILKIPSIQLSALRIYYVRTITVKQALWYLVTLNRYSPLNISVPYTTDVS